MKSLLEKIRSGSTKPAPAPPVRKARSAGGSSAGNQAKTHPPDQDQRRATPAPSSEKRAKSQAVFSSKDDLPDFKRCLSHDSGEVRLDQELRRNYAILLVDESKKLVDIVQSSDARRASNGITQFMDIKSRLTQKGYTLRQAKPLVATRQLVEIIYEVSREDLGLDRRQASELEEEFDSIGRDALKAEASDVHIEIRMDQAKLRYRMNGLLITQREMSVTRAQNMCAVAYQVLAEEKDTTFNSRVPQDAVIDRTIDGKSLRLRLATIPAYPKGFDMVLRVLELGRSVRQPDLPGLGYYPDQVRDIKRIMKEPVGLILVCGVTGSGKSTTLNVALQMKIKEADGLIKVITVENPPEFLLPGATQVPVVLSRDGKNDGSPFAATMKAAMRCDPDILMAGEIRDEHSAELSVGATQSGHQAYGTLHASAAFSAPARLRSMGVRDDVLGSDDFFAGIVYQKLAPRVCTSCSIPLDRYLQHEDNEEAAALVGRVKHYIAPENLANVRFRNRTGCDQCRFGITGRTVVAEVVKPDPQIRAYWARGEFTRAKAYHLSGGGKLILHTVLRKISDGLCCPRDMEDLFTPLDGIQEYGEVVKAFGFDLPTEEIGSHSATAQISAINSPAIAKSSVTDLSGRSEHD